MRLDLDLGCLGCSVSLALVATVFLFLVVVGSCSGGA